jgi:thioesterase domain-containing protein
MAGQYAEQIRSVQGSGSYHLLGWSFGGTAAHAVATRLQALGEQVGVLALLDAAPTTPGDAGDPVEAESVIDRARGQRGTR